MATTQDLRSVVHQGMPSTINILRRLVSIPSVSAPSYPSEPVLEAAKLTEAQLKAAGFQTRWLDLPTGYPSIYGEIAGPPGAPTILLYAHYDVQPGGREQEWISPPFEPTERNGRLYGRGAADDKSAIAIHIATVQAFDGRPPVGIKIIVEGDEETKGTLADYIPQYKDLLRADVIVICDHGNIIAGEPTLTTTLRGSAALTVEVRTLKDQQHNGVFGGPVPDAFIVLCKIIATLHDQHGNIQVPGLDSSDWQGADIPEETLRHAASILPSVDLIGDRPLGAQLWAGYAANVIGLDVPTIAGASNSLIDVVRARINLRIPPDKSAQQALDQLIQHLKSVTPWNAQITISDTHTSDGYLAKTSGPAYAAARQALKEAYNHEAQIIGDGAIIPLADILSKQFPQAEVIIWGVEDLSAKIHGPNEGVLLEELERIILTQALLFQKLTQQ